ncbi:hypothetical protein [Mycolicibacterium palauense]|uniref:hypothetical protein n=1 Tax=Mycolicibacterium palauense TaxID=2034511 RepID=UPI000BFEF794|nr:hypothetical protein [Mycolicibacterium palauense]
MSILHSQLAIFGAIDDIVVEARKGRHPDTDRKVLTTAAKLMPNSTGLGQAGWYRELENFLNRDGIRRGGAVRFPGLEAAVTELNNVPPPNSASSRPNPPEPNGTGGFESHRFYDSARDPALGRAGYAAAVLLRLGSLSGPGAEQQGLAEQLREVVATSVRSFSGGDALASTQVLLDSLEDIDSRSDWTVRAGAAVNSAFAENSRPCFGTLQEIDGQYCSTVVTNSTHPALSVDDVERIVDPMNWGVCSKFFCTMSKGIPNRNAKRWSRVREEVGAECGEYRLITDLVFYKVRQSDGSIFMNYDVDPDREDPGYVEVDNGYIWITPENAQKSPQEKGVRIRTSKQEHVNGLSPCATAALACLMGWADAGKDMLAGTAQRVIEADQAGKGFATLKKFYPSDEDDPNEQEM